MRQACLDKAANKQWQPLIKNDEITCFREKIKKKIKIVLNCGEMKYVSNEIGMQPMHCIHRPIVIDQWPNHKSVFSRKGLI